MSKAELTPEFLQKMHMNIYSAISAGICTTNAVAADIALATENSLRRMLIEVYGLTIDEANEMISKID